MNVLLFTDTWQISNVRIVAIAHQTRDCAHNQMVTMAHQTNTPKSKCSDGVRRTEQQKCERSKFQWPRSWLLYWPPAMACISSREFWTVWKVTPISIHSMLDWKWSSTPKRGDKTQRAAPHCWATGDSLRTFVAVSNLWTTQFRAIASLSDGWWQPHTAYTVRPKCMRSSASTHWATMPWVMCQ